jgi:hypothetical protein
MLTRGYLDGSGTCTAHLDVTRRCCMRSRIDYVYYTHDEGQPYVIGGRYTIVNTPDHQSPGLIENLPHGDYVIL